MVLTSGFGELSLGPGSTIDSRPLSFMVPYPYNRDTAARVQNYLMCFLISCINQTTKRLSGFQ